MNFFRRRDSAFLALTDAEWASILARVIPPPICCATASCQYQRPAPDPLTARQRYWYSRIQGQYICMDCRRQTSLKSLTVFRDTHAPLSAWFYSLFYFADRSTKLLRSPPPSARDLANQLTERGLYHPHVRTARRMLSVIGGKVYRRGRSSGFCFHFRPDNDTELRRLPQSNLDTPTTRRERDIYYLKVADSVEANRILYLLNGVLFFTGDPEYLDHAVTGRKRLTQHSDMAAFEEYVDESDDKTSPFRAYPIWPPMSAARQARWRKKMTESDYGYSYEIDSEWSDPLLPRPDGKRGSDERGEAADTDEADPPDDE